MYTGLQHFHSFWAYLALILLVIAIVNSFLGKSSGRSFLPKDRKLAMFAMVAVHIQLVLGIILLFVGPYWEMVGEFGMGEVMKNSLNRMMVVEHPLTNIIAVILITVGWSKHKKQEAEGGKFKSIAIFYLIGLVLLLSRIPYDAWWS